MTPTDPPPLVPALAAMTLLQGVIAMAVFAPGVLAPRLGLGEGAIGLFAGCVFLVAVPTSLLGGVLVGRLGAFAVALLCMAAVIAAMSIAAVGTLAALVVAAFVLGCAFGPETPASSGLLGQLARPADRPFVFSVRQTGNQFGAMAGSALLPVIALADPRLGFLFVCLVAAAACAVFLALRPRYDPLTVAPAGRRRFADALALLREEPRLKALALVSLPYSAMQLALNAFLVTHAVGPLGLSHVSAGLLLATAQGGGLVGRLGWGLVATRVGSTTAVVAALGPAMGLFAIAMVLVPATTPWLVLLLIAFGFGLTASGWNGVFLAEVAHLAPAGRIAEATGAVLVASYAGLVAGPLVVALLAQIGGLATSFSLLGLAATLVPALLIAQPKPGRV